MNALLVCALTPVSPVSFARVPKLPISPSLVMDESRFMVGQAVCVCQPRTVEEIAAVLHEANKTEQAVRIAGARTGLTGGSVPENELVLDMGAMKSIGPILMNEKTGERTVRAEAGVSLAQIQNYVTDQTNGAYFYPPDPTETTASIGGTIATDASGARTYRYGPTRSWISGIDIMLPNGYLLSVKRGQYLVSPSIQQIQLTSPDEIATITVPAPRYPWPAVKHAGGFYSSPDVFDVIDLFIGSEGLLGIVTAAELRLLPTIPSFSVVQFAPSEKSAFEFVRLLDQDDIIFPEWIEFYDRRSLQFLQTYAQTLPIAIPPNAHSAVFYNIPLADNTDILEETKLLRVFELAQTAGLSEARSMVATDKKQKKELDDLRHLLPETVNRMIAERKKTVPDLHKISTDFSVPADQSISFWQVCSAALTKSKLEWVAFGHIGNAHLHINILPNTEKELRTAQKIYRTLAEKAVLAGGSISAEHGIGRLKRHLFSLQFSPQAITAMQKIKFAIDPTHVLNPNTLWE